MIRLYTWRPNLSFCAKPIRCTKYCLRREKHVDIKREEVQKGRDKTMSSSSSSPRNQPTTISKRTPGISEDESALCTGKRCRVEYPEGGTSDEKVCLIRPKDERLTYILPFNCWNHALHVNQVPRLLRDRNVVLMVFVRKHDAPNDKTPVRKTAVRKTSAISSSWTTLGSLAASYRRRRRHEHRHHEQDSPTTPRAALLILTQSLNCEKKKGKREKKESEKRKR